MCKCRVNATASRLPIVVRTHIWIKQTQKRTNRIGKQTFEEEQRKFCNLIIRTVQAGLEEERERERDICCIYDNNNNEVERTDAEEINMEIILWHLLAATDNWLFLAFYHTFLFLHRALGFGLASLCASVRVTNVGCVRTRWMGANDKW